MKRIFTAVFALSLSSAFSMAEPKRPHIWRIAQATILSTDEAGAHAFYEKLLPAGHVPCGGCAEVPKNGFLVNPLQSIYSAKAPSPTPANLLATITFATDDPEKLRRYLMAQGVECGPPATEKRAKFVLSILDPEKHPILFIKGPHYAEFKSVPPLQKATRLIHAGFIVRDRAAMEHFYKDILGFRPYWHGGMKDDQTDWISLQVPDGTDWVEFMVNVPADADQRVRGIMNHIALGVADIQQAREQLVNNGVHLTEEPKLGRDGKWQLNVYDPDQTRIEFMEFTPKEKPCCSDFTGPHPKP